MHAQDSDTETTAPGHTWARVLQRTAMPDRGPLITGLPLCFCHAFPSRSIVRVKIGFYPVCTVMVDAVGWIFFLRIGPLFRDLQQVYTYIYIHIHYSPYARVRSSRMPRQLLLHVKAVLRSGTLNPGPKPMTPKPDTLINPANPKPYTP